MSIRDCILAKVELGRVDEARAAEAVGLFDELERAASEKMGAGDAAAQAARQTVDRFARQVARKRANTLRQALIAKGIARDLADYRTASGKPAVGRAALGVLSRDLMERSPRANVEARYQSVLGLLHARAEAFLSEFRSKTVGLRRNRAGLKNIVRELFGEDSDDAAAKAAAGAWGDAAEFARLRFNRAGGDIAKRVDWGLPQGHDPLAVGAVSREEWIEFITARLDRAEMIDRRTGAAMSDLVLFDTLVKAYDRIRTNGLSDLTPSLRPAGRLAVANTRQESRVLIFKDAEAWLGYQERFGNPDLFETMTGHLDSMAMDIARVEVLGPNPDATLHFMAQIVQKDAAGQGRAAQDKAASAVNALFRVNDEHTGRAAIPVNARWARGFQALRNVLTSAQLGAASLSAITDFAFQRMARKFNGLPAVSLAIPRILRLMNPLDLGDQKFAVRMGLVADNWSAMALAQKRYTGDVIGPRWSRLFADFTLRASLLSPYTQAGRWAFGLEFAGHLADLVGTRIADMPAPTARAFARYGIGEGDWQRVTAEALQEHRGARFLDIPRLAESEPVAANKLQQMILTETEFAVPTTTSRTRAQLLQGTRAGTFAGEVMRSVAMYKSFPVSIIHLHVMRGLSQDGLTRKGAYLASLMISTTLMGALAWQGKQIARGKDPQDMTDPRFWEAALIQGGGLGLFGDFLFSDVNRFGSGPIVTAAGPVAKFAEDLLRLGLGNLRQGVEGKRTNVGREAVRFAKRYIPGGSLWYARLAMERLIFDELQRMADPDAARAFTRAEKRLRRTTGQRYFWRPGRPRPERGPRIGIRIE